MTAPVSHTIRRVSDAYNHSGPRQPFFLFLSVQNSINYTAYSPLYYKIGVALDDFAQLWTNVSVLSTFKVDEAELLFSKPSALTAHLHQFPLPSSPSLHGSCGGISFSQGAPFTLVSHFYDDGLFQSFHNLLFGLVGPNVMLSQSRVRL